MNYNVIINLAYSFDEEQINKIIKIQATIRGMEMRDKIKLKSKKRKLKETIEREKEQEKDERNEEDIFDDILEKQLEEKNLGKKDEEIIAKKEEKEKEEKREEEKEQKINTNVFIYDNNIDKEIDKNDLELNEKYEKIIVNN